MDENGINLNILETSSGEKVQQTVPWSQLTEEPKQSK
jgi:hypothetical protein